MTLHNHENSLSIKSIEVTKLFGYYTYKLNKNELSGTHKLLILYGDNGSGKTTLLRLLFYLLSTQDNVGHKTEIAKIKFKKIEICFENGITVSALREGQNYEGSYKYRISENDVEKYNILLKVNQSGAIRFQAKNERTADLEYSSALSYLKQLNLSIFFLTDDRVILSSASNNNHIGSDDDYFVDIFSQTKNILNRRVTTKGIISDSFEVENKSKRNIPVIEALNRLTNWIKGRLILDSNVGEKNTNIVYVDIVRAIGKAGFSERKSNNILEEKEKYIKTLQNISERTEDFSKYGFVPEFDLKEIKEIISSPGLKSKDFFTIINILEPFYQGIEARLNALQQLKETIEGFLKSINSYFTNKQISYNVTKGFILRYKEGEVLSVDMLSSGERQFLLLLCNTITATEEATIFIIDEPEISLNVKWQRKLLDTLLQFSRDNQQFIIATHSIELLTNHKNNIVKLQEYEH